MRIRKLFVYAFALIMVLTTLSGCKQNDNNGNKVVKYEGPYSQVNGTYAGVDSLGRKLTEDGLEPREDRYVGVFYFLWQGQHGTSGPHDNNKIVAENPDALKSEANWIKYGGGAQGAHHFWGEPLFGYYTSNDEWVMHKHVQMLTDAGVDFLVFDTTNGPTYSDQALKLLKILDYYSKQGWNVPKISFYTNSASGATLNSIYTTIYKKHPEYQHLWFYWDEKPMVIGAPDDKALKKETKDFFRIKHTQWPNEYKDGEFYHNEDGFPWMSFEDKQWVFTNSAGEAEVMSVSLAQHSGSVRFSRSAWYDPEHKDNRTRSYHNGANDTSPDAYLYGYNFAEQFEYAIEKDPKIIFITGWNEWVAQRQPSAKNEAIVFVDCADPNNSRDAEPMKGGFADNYYMQRIDYITPSRVNAGENTTIDVNGDFSQWDNVTAVYKDYTGDTVDRNANGFGTGKKKLVYKDETGRNDFDTMKAAKDNEYIYFFASTVEDITSASDTNWMTIFINSGNNSESNWEGYDFVVNRVSPTGNEAVIEKCNGGYSWSEVGKAQLKVEGNKIMLKVPRELLGIPYDNGKGLIDLRFKWADNYQPGESGDVFSFYLNGDCAPYGRQNYIFNEKARG